ncbi:hypothetical protein [Vallicoccus soli]|uniref:hypothetical protein n=1 Tax=Vallicoccus soli TaxID=2339232 RepID=UPI001C498F06|nr:hypothetical protein [Vallicoccus soli]
MAHTPSTSPSSGGPSGPSSGRREKAGAFDVRTVIGALLVVYGVILTVMGLFFTTEEQLAKADDLNINLWTGLGLLVVGGLFLLWVRLRPILVPVDEVEQQRDGQDAHGVGEPGASRRTTGTGGGEA